MIKELKRLRKIMAEKDLDLAEVAVKVHQELAYASYIPNIYASGILYGLDVAAREYHGRT